MAWAPNSPSIKPTRTWAAVLAGLDDEQLAALLTARPDLVRPSPVNFDQLASRVVSWPSVRICFDTLDLAHRQLLEALCLLPAPSCAHRLADLLDPSLDADELAAPLDRLETLALVRSEDGHNIWVNPAFKQLRFPAGLGPPADHLFGGYPTGFVTQVAKRLGLRPERTKGATIELIGQALIDPEIVRRAIDAGPPGTAELAARLSAGPPVLIVAGSYYSVSDRTPQGWLNAHGLLAIPGWGEAVMPGEVGLALRDNTAFPRFSLHRPAPATTEVEAAALDAAAADAAVRLLSDLMSVIGDWETAPPKVLKTGGVGVRDVRRVAATTGRSEADAARIIELAVLAGLGAVDQRGEIVLPTAGFDRWLADEPGPRWAAVVDAWMAGGHHLSAALEPGVGGAPARPLLPRLRTSAPDQRRMVLDAFADLPPGQAADRQGLADAVTWPRPVLWNGPLTGSATDVAAVVAETELIGLCAGGGFSTAGRLAAARRFEDAGRALAELIPAVVSDFTVQADLTAVAAGTLTATVRAELDLLADVESTGAATVFRFSPSSVARAFEAGRTAEQISAWLAEHARNQVPQPLTYLIGDLGRRYGRLRVGAARAYLRCDDPALTTEVLRARAAAGLSLRELAPGVLVSPAEPAAVVTVLRAAGYLPAQESADGGLLISRPAPPRAPGPAGPASKGGRPSPADPRRATPEPGTPVTPVTPGAGAGAGGRSAAADSDAQAVITALRRAPKPWTAPAAAAGPPARSRSDLSVDEAVALFTELGFDFDDDDLDAYLADLEDHPGDGGSVPLMPRPTGIVKDPEGIVDLVSLALAQGWALRVGYTNRKGQEREQTVGPTMIDGNQLMVAMFPQLNRETLAVDRIHWARVLTDAEEEML